MTEQEAIKIIDCNRPYEAIMRKTEKEAFDMAIKALEKQISLKKIVERLEQQAEQYHRREKEYEDKNVTVQISKKYFGKACSYEHAIDIVKEEGGLNGQM